MWFMNDLSDTCSQFKTSWLRNCTRKQESTKCFITSFAQLSKKDIFQ